LKFVPQFVILVASYVTFSSIVTYQMIFFFSNLVRYESYDESSQVMKLVKVESHVCYVYVFNNLQQQRSISYKMGNLCRYAVPLDSGLLSGFY